MNWNRQGYYYRDAIHKLRNNETPPCRVLKEAENAAERKELAQNDIDPRTASAPHVPRLLP